MTDEEIERIEALVVRASAWAASRPLVSALSAILAERKELLRRVEEAEKHEGEAIDERDAWQEYVASLAAATGCDREWSSEHDHRRCVSDAIDTLRRELAEARGNVKWCEEAGEFVEGCWTDQGGIHLRIEENRENGRAILIFEAGPGGRRLAAVSLSLFRRERIAAAIRALSTTAATEGSEA